LEFGDVGFCGGRKTREQGENQQQTQSTYGSRPESKLGHMVEAGALTTAPSQCSPMIN